MSDDKDKKPEPKPDVIEGGLAVGGSLIGAYWIWMHRPLNNLSDLIKRGITDPEFLILKEQYFYGGLLLCVVIFFYGLSKLRILK